MKKELLRKLPSVDAVITSEAALTLIETYGRTLVLKSVRDMLDYFRSEIREKETPGLKPEDLSLNNIIIRVKAHLEKKALPSLRRAINAAGVILHTGLGRAVLSREAAVSINDVVEGYCTLAADIETGRRGHRDIHLDSLICELTGAEAATVVNNNAAATVLVLNSLAKDKEVIISRGQLVEIGGAFRMPDVMETSGAIMREVGTTNKTHLRDYASAINENTGAILRVHHSNYRIMGFFEEPPIEDLIKLGNEHDIPVIDDLGSGALVDIQEFGLQTEPLVRRSITAGVTVACFSGDKLIGGPQSGVIVGKADCVKQIRKNPLARAFRVGKMTIAGMEATLKLFLDPEKLTQNHPIYRMFSADLDVLKKRARKVANKLKNISPESVEIAVEDGKSQVGSGTSPVETLPTKVLRITPLKTSAESLAQRLRLGQPPIFTRVHKDTVLFDFRTIQPNEDVIIQKMLLSLLADMEKPL